MKNKLILPIPKIFYYVYVNIQNLKITLTKTSGPMHFK